MAHSSSSISNSDTTYTKIFVGGLAWETHRDTMRKYFEQYGEILEAVVITDRVSGRSKGYGFVTFRDPESARKACMDPTPIIDGRRANCNLASLGQKHRQFYGQFGPQGGGSGYGGFPSPSNPYGYAQGYGYPPYGYPQFPEGFGFPQGIYPYGPGFSPMPGVYGSPGSMAAGGMYGGYSGFSPGNLQNLPGSPNFGSSQMYPQGQQPQMGNQAQMGGSGSGLTKPGSPMSMQQQSQEQQQQRQQQQQLFNGSQNQSSGNNLLGSG